MPQPSLHTGEYTYTCLFEPDPDGGFTVTCPALPGLVTEGDTFEEARVRAAEAMELYLESARADGERLPVTEESVPGTIREPVTVMLPAVIRGLYGCVPLGRRHR
jgi:antitoxin HicB